MATEKFNEMQEYNQTHELVMSHMHLHEGVYDDPFGYIKAEHSDT